MVTHCSLAPSKPGSECSGDGGSDECDIVILNKWVGIRVRRHERLWLSRKSSEVHISQSVAVCAGWYGDLIPLAVCHSSVCAMVTVIWKSAHMPEMKGLAYPCVAASALISSSRDLVQCGVLTTDTEWTFAEQCSISTVEPCEVIL